MTETCAAEGQPLGAILEGGPAAAPTRVPLIGRLVHVVPLDPAAHAAELYAASHGAGDAALWTYLISRTFPDPVAFRAYYEAAALRDDPLLFAILDAATGKALGHAAYMRIEPAHRVIEVGNVLFTRALQRSAAASEAMYLMARHVFEDLGYRRYEWKCDALNAPSRRAALRFGFSFEGIFRQHMIVKGRSRDTAWFAMLDHEWPAVRAAFEAWLAPENFSPDGQQKRRLEDIRAGL
ncbi:GNAT family protein [Xanthobacter sp. DSM 24535]|uniref:GNAT family N-acetyltransferase n=1 Tax=Roseixanthobacter psychrophilus TaxID=3119917 RepID=UPI00372966F2